MEIFFHKSQAQTVIQSHAHLFNIQHIYKLQQFTIPLLLPSGQRTMHRGLLNKKSLGPFRPVRPTGLDFQAGPRAARPVAISSSDCSPQGRPCTNIKNVQYTRKQKQQMSVQVTANARGIIRLERLSGAFGKRGERSHKLLEKNSVLSVVDLCTERDKLRACTWAN